MEKTIREIMDLPKEIEQYFIATLSELSEDDKGNKVKITDAWMEEHLAAVGLIEKTIGMDYPKEAVQSVVFSKKEALNLDNIAVSYAKTRRKKDCMYENVTLSTVDAFFVNGKKECYLIEFKNGDWNKKDIKIKIYESIALLNNLKIMDEYAVIKGNRGEDKIEAEALNLSEKLTRYAGICDNAGFYKKNVRFLLVYTGNSNIITKYADLCQKREEMEWINTKLQELNLRKLKTVETMKHQPDFGYEFVDKLAVLLLSSTSINRNFERFHKIQQMLDRIKCLEHDEKKIKYIYEKLNQYPKLIKVFYKKMYGDDREAKNFVNKYYTENTFDGKAFFILAAKMSVERMDRPENNKIDDYKRVEQILRCFITSKWSDFSGQIALLSREIENKIPELKQTMEKFSEQSFCDFENLLINENYEEAIKRAVFIDRIFTCECTTVKIEKKIKVEWMTNICGMSSDISERIADVTNENTRQFLQILIIWNYLYNTVSILDIPEIDSYRHIVRQIHYLNSLENGHIQKQKYGVFFGRIEAKTRNLTGKAKTKKVVEEVEKIKKKIIEGRSLNEMMPLERSIELSISKEQREIRDLQASLADTMLLDVLGCKGIDFSESMLEK